MPRTSRIEYPQLNTEEESRKALISQLGEKPASDRLTLYIRKPSDTPLIPTRIDNTITQHNSTDIEQDISDKVDIDQDNIETPPATRKIFSASPVDKREPTQRSPCSRLLSRTSKESLGSPEEPETNPPLGDGQFDRFSIARRTRRYKRNVDNNEISSSELIAEKEVIKTNLAQVESSVPVVTDQTDQERRLKAWQDKLKTPTKLEVKPPSTRRTRHQTGINQDDVKAALSIPLNKNTSNKNSGTTKTYINPDDKTISSIKIDIPSRKTKEHDNDEGFEESQSLMSESPSQGASSGGNYETDVVEPNQITITNYITPKNLNTQVANVNQVMDKTVPKSKDKQISNSKPQSTSQKINRSFDRANPARHTLQESKKSIIPRRSNSLRKNDSQPNISNRNNNVLRSASKTSIAGSRSSLNSATSTNTVRRIPAQPCNSNMIPTKNVRNSIPKLPTPNITKINLNLKRNQSFGCGGTQQKPPRPQNSSFMKPTTSSTTKTNGTNALVSSRLSSSFRGKH